LPAPAAAGAGFLFYLWLMSETLITLKDVSKIYSADSNAGVNEISLSIEKGDFVAIVGESGSGKSTLLKLIYGALAPDSGELRFKGEHIPGPHEKLIPGHDSMKMLSQDFDLNLYAKVYENIESMLSNENLADKKQKSLDMMQLLGIEDLANKRIVELSGGEQQRVALARAVITQPDVLLLDEPFSQLDALLKVQLRADLKRLSSELGITVIMVSHDPVDGLTLADKMFILKDGLLIESGRPAHVYENPGHIYTARLLGNAFVLPADEAKVMGIRSKAEHVMIYPEWVELKSSWSSRKYEVEEIFFRGFYEDLLLVHKGVKIHAVNTKPGVYKKGQGVQVIIRRYLEF
jgi:multiple sugar transport system ATP-binding protein